MACAMPPSGGGDAGAHRPGQEGQGHQVVSLPLLTPRTFLCAATPFGRAAKRGLRGLGSGRRFAYRTLLCPEFTLRDLPRITVRGQTVQGGGVPLRKAPLRSIVYPWSTKRPCGPLAFRRATAGSRVRRRVWGCQEGAREPYGALAPFCLRRQTAALPAAEGGNARSAHRQPSLACGGKPPERRNRFPSAEGKAQIASAPGREHFFIPRRDFPPCGSPHRPR